MKCRLTHISEERKMVNMWVNKKDFSLKNFFTT